MVMVVVVVVVVAVSFTFVRGRFAEGFFLLKKKRGLKGKSRVRHRSSSKDFHLLFLYRLLRLPSLLRRLRTVILILLSLNPLSTLLF